MTVIENNLKMNKQRNAAGEIFEPYFEYMSNQVEKEFIVLGLKNEKVIESLRFQITKKCMWIPFRCLTYEMHELKEKGMLLGNDSEQMYRDYLNHYLKDETYLAWFDNKYPIVKKTIDKKIRDTVCFVDEVMRNLEQDKHIIIRELCNGKGFNAIDDMELYLSDEHISGKTVVRISLNNGCTVYYKPKNLFVNQYYQELFSWLMGCCGQENYSYRMVCRETYGWEKEIVQMPCFYEQEVKQYYINIGIHLSLAYVLGVTDIHFENVIAHGKFPMITDVEFQANIGCDAFIEKERLQDYLDDNVLLTGLLPVRAWLGGNSIVCGIEDVEGQRVPVKMPIVFNKGTAEMIIGYDYPEMKPGNNVPILDGNKCCYRTYIKQIVKGFEMGYKSILDNKNTFITKFRYGFRYVSRVLMRNTQEYFMYGNLLNFPELMQDEDKRRDILRHMAKGLKCNEEYKEYILEYEMKIIYKGEIPVFYAENRHLITGSGEVFERYYDCDIRERIIKHVRKLSKKNGKLQKRVMNVQFYNLFRREDYNAEDNSDIRPIIGRLTPKNIADYLLQNIWEINGKYEWVTLQYFKSDIRLGAADHYLYGGISGLAVFFAAMNIKYDNAIYRLTFERIVYQIRLHTDNDAGKGDEWGLFTGEASIIYTYLLLYKIIEDNIYLVYAQKQADRMMGKDLSTIEGDDLLGGKAGVIIAYLSLYGFTDDRRYLEFAIIIGERLLAGGGKREKGIGWFNSGQSNLAGIAHGNSGIALACAFLWKYCKSGRYIQYIKEAIDYEDILYNAKLCNWQDIREHEAEKDMVAWCHGCGGIFLARKKIHELTGIPLEELFSVIAVKNDNQNAELDYVWNVLEEKMFAAKKEEGCLCHGSLGVYVLLKQINKEKAEIYRKEIKNYSLSFEDMNNVGFMNGIAGIGYTLLDEDNFEVPNVLNLGVLTEN